MSAGLDNADVNVVAKFLDIPADRVKEDLAAMSPTLKAYMEELFKLRNELLNNELA